MYKCNVENVPHDIMVLLIPTYKCKNIQHRRHNGSSLLGARKIKGAIKFVRALITNFHITSLIWKIDKTRIYLEWCNTPCIGIYSGNFGITWFLRSWMHE